MNPTAACVDGIPQGGGMNQSPVQLTHVSAWTMGQDAEESVRSRTRSNEWPESSLAMLHDHLALITYVRPHESLRLHAANLRWRGKVRSVAGSIPLHFSTHMLEALTRVVYKIWGKTSRPIVHRNSVELGVSATLDRKTRTHNPTLTNTNTCRESSRNKHWPGPKAQAQAAALSPAAQA